jgi:hypothetical protein
MAIKWCYMLLYARYMVTYGDKMELYAAICPLIWGIWVHMSLDMRYMELYDPRCNIYGDICT